MIYIPIQTQNKGAWEDWGGGGGGEWVPPLDLPLAPNAHLPTCLPKGKHFIWPDVAFNKSNTHD